MTKFIGGLAFSALIALILLNGIGLVDTPQKTLLGTIAGLLLIGLVAAAGSMGHTAAEIKVAAQVQQLSDLTRRYEARIVRLEKKAGIPQPRQIPQPPAQGTSS